MYVGKNPFCHASVLMGPRRAVARWGEAERSLRLSLRACAEARYRGFRDDDGARGVTAGKIRANFAKFTRIFPHVLFSKNTVRYFLGDKTHRPGYTRL